MARTAEGKHLFQDRRTGIYQVRFTHSGHRHSHTTGERAFGAGSREADRIYTEVLAGRWEAGRQIASPVGKMFDEVAVAWLERKQARLDEQTFRLYLDTYIARHLVPFFLTIDRLTTSVVEDYVTLRLSQVGKETVKKELAVLRQIAKYAKKEKLIDEMPDVTAPERNVVGTDQPSSRKRKFFAFPAEEMEAIIARLPVFAASKRSGQRFPVRARFVLAWRYALRPETLNLLSVPEHYRPGAPDLAITERIDKNRYPREFEITDDVRSSLELVCPARGIIFGEHDYRGMLRAAAREVGIDSYRAERISDYDFRHSALTHLGSQTTDLLALMVIAGHRQPATTAKYIHAPKKAADELLRAASRLRTRPVSEIEKVDSAIKAKVDELLRLVWGRR